MTVTQFDFGQWLPDAPDLDNPGLIRCTNVIPVGNSYYPIQAPVASGAQVAGNVAGATRIIRPDGSQVLAIGTSSDLFTVVGDIVTASDLSLTASAPWSFVPFGRMLWAFSAGQVPHYIENIGFDTAFIPHPGVAPKASTAARVGDFIVVGNIEDITAESDPYRIRWSRFNDPAADWADDIATQGGAVDMPVQNGPVIAVAGGNFGIVFQRFGVARLEYTGGATVFAKTEISAGRGCSAVQSVVQVAGVTYFLSDDGFFKTDGTAPSPISSLRVWNWFLNEADGGELESVQAAIDWRSRCIIWSFKSAVGGAGEYDRQIIYSWESDRWSSAEIAVGWLFDTIKSRMTLEQVSAIYPDIDTMLPSLDSSQFKARGRSLTGLLGGYVCDMTGDTMEAVVETGEFQPAAGSRCCVNGVSVLAENSSENALVRLGGRDTFKGEPVRWTMDAKEGADGMAHPVIDGRYVRARVTIPAASQWSKMSGIQVEYVRTGRA